MVTSSLHHELFIHASLIEAAGGSSSQGMVRLVALDTCFCAQSTDSRIQLHVPCCLFRKPACWSGFLQRLQVKSIRWSICWTQTEVELEQFHKAAIGVCCVGMLDNYLLRDFSTFFDRIAWGEIKN